MREGVFLEGLQTVYINSMARVYYQNVFEKQCTIRHSLQHGQRCVGMSKHVCVGVPECDCNCVRVPLK